VTIANDLCLFNLEIKPISGLLNRLELCHLVSFEVFYKWLKSSMHVRLHLRLHLRC